VHPKIKVVPSFLPEKHGLSGPMSNSSLADAMEVDDVGKRRDPRRDDQAPDSAVPQDA
jgi:hypothetical protein